MNTRGAQAVKERDGIDEGKTTQAPRFPFGWRDAVPVGTLIFGIVTSGALAYGQFDAMKRDFEGLKSNVAMKSDVEELKGKVARQGTDQADQVGRVIRLETRMEIIIDQNKEILAAIRAKP